MDLGVSSRVVGSGRRGIVGNEAFEETGDSIIEERIWGRKEGNDAGDCLDSMPILCSC